MNEIRTLSQLLNALSHGYSITTRANTSQSLSQSVAKQKTEERHFCISLAGHTIAINSLYSEVFFLCQDFFCDGDPELYIDVCENDILTERSDAKQLNSRSDSYLETLVVYRKISEALLSFDTFLMHGAVISLDEQAYLFTADSGTGKTTHIKKWLENDKRTIVVNGDKPLIKVDNDKILACGTPWNGKERMGTNIMVPLKSIVLMERAEENHIEMIQFGQAFPLLLQQTYRPNEGCLFRKTLSLLKRLNNQVLIYKFRFNNLKEDTFRIAYETLTGNRNEHTKT